MADEYGSPRNLRRCFPFAMVGERDRHEHVHAAQQMALGDPIFEPELIEQAALDPAAAAPSSPRPPMPIIDQPPESRFAGLLKPFFDSIDPIRS